MNEDHSQHPGIPPNWHSLSPSTPSGTYYRCYVVLGKENGHEVLCSESYFSPSERCRCAPGNHGVHFTGNQFQPWRANRTIWRGKCSECGLIVPGEEEEADSDPDGY